MTSCVKHGCLEEIEKSPMGQLTGFVGCQQEPVADTVKGLEANYWLMAGT